MAVVFWTDQALADIQLHYNFIAINSEWAARRIANKIIDKGDSLAQWPNKGRQIPELNDPRYREIF